MEGAPERFLKVVRLRKVAVVEIDMSGSKSLDTLLAEARAACGTEAGHVQSIGMLLNVEHGPGGGARGPTYMLLSGRRMQLCRLHRTQAQTLQVTAS